MDLENLVGEVRKLQCEEKAQVIRSRKHSGLRLNVNPFLCENKPYQRCSCCLRQINCNLFACDCLNRDWSLAEFLGTRELETVSFEGVIEQ